MEYVAASWREIVRPLEIAPVPRAENVIVAIAPSGALGTAGSVTVALTPRTLGIVALVGAVFEMGTETVCCASGVGVAVGADVGTAFAIGP